MAIDLNSISTKSDNKPPRLVIYGVEGIGKTTICANAPSPIFIQTEDGLGMIDAPHFPLAETYNDVQEALRTLYKNEHRYKTVVIDSLDWLETLIWQQLVADRPTNEKGHPIKSIDDYGYGKGYVYAMDYWQNYITAINCLRSKGMTIIQTAHSEIKRFDDPNSDPYDRYQIKLHKGASALVREHADAVLFCNYRIATTQADTGFNSTKTRAIGSGERLLFTEERPGFLAKNRYAMPTEVALDWQDVAKSIPYFNPTKES